MSAKTEITDGSDAGFIVWGIDRMPYGPVELPMLVAWIKDERVLADTWVFVGATGKWQKAAEMPDLQFLFRPKDRAGLDGSVTCEPAAAINARALRRIKILANMSDEALGRLAWLTEIHRVSQWATVVKEGEIGDAMFLILEGEFRVRTMAAGRETILATLGTGEFFGDMCLLDRGPRSADVVANTDGVLLRISRANFERVGQEAPELAARLALSMGRTLSARIRTADKRLRDSMKLACAVA